MMKTTDQQALHEGVGQIARMNGVWSAICKAIERG